MIQIGTLSLALAFIGTCVVVVLSILLAVKTRAQNSLRKDVHNNKASYGMASEAHNCDQASEQGLSKQMRLVSTACFACIIGICVLLTICCLVLIVCFVSGDNSMTYVVQYRSNSESDLAPLYVLSGLWGGRQGSLLFWAWLISVFNCFVAVRNRNRMVLVDRWACAIAHVVLAAFLGVLLFSESNFPFAAMSALYLTSSGELTNGAQYWGLNPLLEHWAMAIHPPTLFIGYAGMTIPFAYALAAFISGDDSDTWVLRVNGITMFAWLFLGIGIGLGAVWAYVVLGWGGYWGWDPVENASLLSWLLCVALIHSFTLYRKRSLFKRWSVVCACLTFMFVIVGTFISRSGIVQSVHAFEGDSVSLVLFGFLIGAAFLAALAGAVLRRKSFAVDERYEQVATDEAAAADTAASTDEEDSFFSRSMAYYLNNVIMVVGAFMLAYLTISSALPSYLPFGGESLDASTYNAIARPLSILLLLIVALCPLLGWHKTNPKAFFKTIKIPAIAALICFVLLMVYFVQVLLPAYDAMIAAGGTLALDLLQQGPAWYYHGLAIVGFAVASLLICNSVYMLIKALKRTSATTDSTASTGSQFRLNASRIGGLVAHASLGILLIGLVGSSMYTTEVTGYLAASEESTANTSLDVGSYTVSVANRSATDQAGDGYFYTLDVLVEENGATVGHVYPSIQLDPFTNQQNLHASVISYVDHDVFVVFRGLNTSGDYSMDVRINPLISFVWVGFVLLMIGTALGLFANRSRPQREEQKNA